MYKYLLFALILSLSLYSQTEPDIIVEKTYNIIDEYEDILEPISKLIKNNGNYYLTYNWVNEVSNDYSGVVKLNEQLEIISQVEYWNHKKTLGDILFYNDKEYLLSKERKDDAAHPNYKDFFFPILNILEEDTVSSSIYGDAIDQNYRNYLTHTKGDIIYIFAEKVSINDSDTLKQNFIDKYDYNLNLIESVEIDTSGYAIENPTFPTNFYALEDGSYLVSQRGPFVDFNFLFLHSALTRFDQNGKIIKSDRIYKEQYAWYNDIYLLSDNTFTATGSYKKSATEFFSTITKYDSNFEVVWNKNISPIGGNTDHYYDGNVPLNDGKYYISFGRRLINPLTQESLNLIRIFDSEVHDLVAYAWGEVENEFVVRDVYYVESDNTLIVFSINGDKNFKIYKIGNFTSVNENIEKDRISISPNPVKDELKIENYEIGINHKIEIYNVLGEKVLTANMSENNIINVSHLTPGVYFIKIGDKVEKFVK